MNLQVTPLLLVLPGAGPRGGEALLDSVYEAAGFLGAWVGVWMGLGLWGFRV